MARMSRRLLLAGTGAAGVTIFVPSANTKVAVRFDFSLRTFQIACGKTVYCVVGL